MSLLDSAVRSLGRELARSRPEVGVQAMGTCLPCPAVDASTTAVAAAAGVEGKVDM